MVSDKVKVPRVATLEGFTEIVNNIKGIFIKDIPALAILEVVTQNSTYILVVDPVKQTVLIKGGKYLPELVECIYHGSVLLGGINLKMKWIGIGMCMNFKIPQDIPPETTVTSPVKSIRILEQATQIIH